jgi:uncharacterized protein (TIGR03067 family)
MFISMGTFLTTTALLFSAGVDDQAVKDEMAKLAGTWQMTACEQNGAKAPAEWVAKRRFILAADGRFSALTDGDSEINAGQVVLHLSGTPSGLDFRTESGPFASHTVNCIYERNGDELKVCFAAFGTVRPTAFVSGPGSGQAVTVYKRTAAK